MALKETLVRLKRQQEDATSFEADKAGMRDEWVAAVGAVVETLRMYLEPFENDGTLKLQERDVDLTEDMLGTYTVRGVTIDAGAVRIEVTPVARVVVGAVGRIDLSRQGFAKSSNRILMLRHEDDDGAKRWVLRMPMAIAAAREFGGITRQFDFDYLPFDRENVEKAIDFLLNL